MTFKHLMKNQAAGQKRGISFSGLSAEKVSTVTEYGITPHLLGVVAITVEYRAEGHRCISLCNLLHIYISPLSLENLTGEG